MIPASTWLQDVVSHYGLWVGFVAVFFGGVALNLTPCVYPMIPVTIAFFTSQAAFSTLRPRRALGRVIWLAIVYVLGISLSYALLGIMAASSGALLGSWLQHPAILIGIAMVIVALSLSMFGVYELRVPQALLRHLSQASAGLWGAFVMGLVVGLVAAPCIGPFVLALALLVTQLGNPVTGFFLFFVLGLGMGLPYVILAVVANRVGRLPKAGAWLVWSKKALGVVLLGLALYFLRPVLPVRLLTVALAGLLLWAGVYLGWLERSATKSFRFLWIRRVVGAILVLASIVVIWPRVQAGPSVAWTPYTQAAFEHAKREHQPVVIDLYADWCLPCLELDHTTFRHPNVVQALSGIATLRIDATREVSPDGEQLVDRYHLYGLPTVLFFNRDGQEQPSLRVTGFVDSDEFLELLSKIQ